MVDSAAAYNALPRAELRARLRLHVPSIAFAGNERPQLLVWMANTDTLPQDSQGSVGREFPLPTDGIVIGTMADGNRDDPLVCVIGQFFCSRRLLSAE